MTEHVDVLIVGAGLSGIGAAHQLQRAFPRRTYAILEARDAIGGTWDLFRYPGVRSDSDMQTLGYRWRPWTGAKAIADGPVDPAVRPGHGGRVRHRPPHPVRVPGDAGVLVQRGRAVDGRGQPGREPGRRPARQQREVRGSWWGWR